MSLAAGSGNSGILSGFAAEFAPIQSLAVHSAAMTHLTISRRPSHGTVDHELRDPSSAEGHRSADARPAVVATEAPLPQPDVDIVIPVYNEAHVLDASIRRLHAYLLGEVPLDWRITIVDNGSTDDTWAVASSLCHLDDVDAIHLALKGRGRALRAAWSQSSAKVVAYMDVDLSTGLDALWPMVASVLSGHTSVAIGSRLTGGSRVVRSTKREFVSRMYNRILRWVLGVSFRDAQCGFKAVDSEACAQLLPEVLDDAWFFDTELLVAAERRGMRITEIPVDWVEDPDSRVDVLHTAYDDLRGVWRLCKGVYQAPGEPATTRRG